MPASGTVNEIRLGAFDQVATGGKCASCVGLLSPEGEPGIEEGNTLEASVK